MRRDDRIFHRRKPYHYFGYALFLLYPVVAYTTSAHRLPIYFLLYLLLMSILIFDGIDKVELTMKKSFFIILLSAVLTQWRTEGIYLLVIVPILMLFAYGNLRKFKPVVLLIIGTIVVQYLVSVPQNGLVASEMSAAADDRMKPFYAYTITNMYRNGLDEEKNANDNKQHLGFSWKSTSSIHRQEIPISFLSIQAAMTAHSIPKGKYPAKPITGISQTLNRSAHGTL